MDFRSLVAAEEAPSIPLHYELACKADCLEVDECISHGCVCVPMVWQVEEVVHVFETRYVDAGCKLPLGDLRRNV